jgi:hypothetical protein
VGKRKLGLEFMIAAGSFLATFLLGHFVTARPGGEAIVFYIVGIYSMLIYLATGFTDPGWLSTAQKKNINQLVRSKGFKDFSPEIKMVFSSYIIALIVS